MVQEWALTEDQSVPMDLEVQQWALMEGLLEKEAPMEDKSAPQVLVVLE